MNLSDAMSLFIMESVIRFGIKPVQVGKFIIAVSTEFLESQYKIYLKTLQSFNYNRFPSFHWLYN